MSLTPPLCVPGLPRHVALIMDGNGRWAKQHRQPTVFGHKRGASTLKSITQACLNMGLPYLTVYAFSSENWCRPEKEVQGLMGLLKIYLSEEVETLIERDISLRVIGDRSRFDPQLQELMHRAESETEKGRSLTLQVALGYGARGEITRAFKTMAAELLTGTLSLEDFTEETVSRHLYTHGIPDPDLIIRTSGEQRLSNFLLWQSAYSELFFTPTLWPAFTEKEFAEIIDLYGQRQRRFGGKTPLAFKDLQSAGTKAL